ncbi:MAG: Nif3-like dinuclear metal center hexameric protein [Planctomycetes bacterium]|nr:Nif3-like dinuclear metal center hexameric protein [Planctomycetota bacterium]
MPGTTLARVLDALEEIAPLELAADWDNVGLLLDPRGRRHRIERILLTIDLTDDVVAEARFTRSDLVVAYHPAIFQPLRRLGVGDGKQRALLGSVAAGFALYSPHTALDAAPGGIADWLADGVLGGDEPAGREPCGDGEFGRVVELPRPIPFARFVQRIKQHLGRRQLQVARAPTSKSVRSAAVAAGAGGSIVRGESVDVILTGEMSHHDVLAALANGTSVVLAGHTNTERGYLKILRKRLRSALGDDVDIAISKSDRDPIAIV